MGGKTETSSNLLLPENKESHPENRTASNDCLPYEKKDYFAAEVSAVAGAAVVSTGATTAVSTITGATVVVSTVVVSSVVVSLHAAKAPIANTNKSFFIVPCFVY